MNPIIAYCLQIGLPAPRTEYRFCKRRWRFDYAFPTLMVALEIEGGIWTQGRHTRGKGYEADICKYNEATALGWSVFRATTDMVADGRAFELLDRIATLYALEE